LKKNDDEESCKSDLTSPTKNFERDPEDAITFDQEHNIQITVKNLKEPFLERKKNSGNCSKNNDNHYKRFINLRTRGENSKNNISIFDKTPTINH